MPRLRPTIRQRAAIAAAMADAKGQDAKSQDAKSQDTKMDSAEAHLHQVCPLFSFPSTLDCTSLGAPSSQHENQKAFSCILGASLSTSKPSLDLQLESLPDTSSQTPRYRSAEAIIRVLYLNPLYSNSPWE